MTSSDPLDGYIRMIEDFLAGRIGPQEFSESFFKAFQQDETHWDEEWYEPLNAVALASESYTPRESGWPWNINEAQLRVECAEPLAQLHALRSKRNST